MTVLYSIVMALCIVWLALSAATFCWLWYAARHAPMMDENERRIE